MAPILQSPSYEQLSLRVAHAIVDQIRTKPKCCLGLPTGHTPLLTYQILSNWSSGQGNYADSDAPAIDWSQVLCFALDDYYNVDEKHTFQAFLEKHLYSHTNLPLDNRLNPIASEDYDQLIESCGGLDLTVLGIGGNGHIAFNEPGTMALSYTHCIWLAESTRLANQDAFGSLEETPITGITMGLQTILGSARIILMANSEAKRGIVERAFSGQVTLDVPASLLQTHSNADVWTDFGYEKNFCNKI
ncbi:glucosamine-6-phosphate deaminase [soil metagenome]